MTEDQGWIAAQNLIVKRLRSRTRFAWLPIYRWSAMYYRAGSYWLRTVVERRTADGWKAFEADNKVNQPLS